MAGLEGGSARRLAAAPPTEGQDLLAGSIITGQVAKNLERSWINAEYVAGSQLCFPDATLSGSSRFASGAP
jgi:hypothetical protein